MPKEAEACTGLVRHDGVDVGRDPDSILTFIVDPQQARFTLDTFYRFWYILSTFDARVLWFLTGVRHLRSVCYLLPLFNKKQQQYMGYWLPLLLILSYSLNIGHFWAFCTAGTELQ